MRSLVLVVTKNLISWVGQDLKTCLDWGSLTDAGQVRPQNEDSLLAQEPVFVVADGMGGHAAGDVASNLVVSTFAQLATLGCRPTPSDVDAAITASNRAVVDAAAQAANQAGMGSTLVGLILVNNGGSESWLGFHIGDSRLYRYVDGALTQLTRDHSVVQEMLDEGSITQAQTANHPNRHEITRALGSSPAPQAEFWFGEPVPGERFLLCSDGLTNEVSDAQIAQTLGQGVTADGVAVELVDRALAAGGRDNISTVVVDVVMEVLVEQSDSSVDESTKPRIDETTRPRQGIVHRS